MRREVKALRANQAQPYSFERIVGNSTSLASIKGLMRKIASSPASTVLLNGEKLEVGAAGEMSPSGQPMTVRSLGSRVKVSAPSVLTTARSSIRTPSAPGR